MRVNFGLAGRRNPWLNASAMKQPIKVVPPIRLKDIDPAGDLNGGPETKRYLAQVVLKRALVRIKNDIARDIERDMAQDTA